MKGTVYHETVDRIQGEINKLTEYEPRFSGGVSRTQAALHSGHFPGGLSVQQKYFEDEDMFSLDYEQVCLSCLL